MITNAKTKRPAVDAMELPIRASKVVAADKDETEREFVFADRFARPAELRNVRISSRIDNNVGIFLWSSEAVLVSKSGINKESENSAASMNTESTTMTAAPGEIRLFSKKLHIGARSREKTHERNKTDRI